MQTGHGTSRIDRTPSDAGRHSDVAVCAVGCPAGPYHENRLKQQLNGEASSRRLLLKSSRSAMSSALDDSFLDVQIRRKQEVLRLRCLAHGEANEETVCAVKGLSGSALDPSVFMDDECWRCSPSEFNLLTSDHRRIARETAYSSTFVTAEDRDHTGRRQSSPGLFSASSRVHGFISRLRWKVRPEVKPEGGSLRSLAPSDLPKGVPPSSSSVFSLDGSRGDRLSFLHEGLREAALQQLDALASGEVENQLDAEFPLESSEVWKRHEQERWRGGKSKSQLMHAPQSKLNVYNQLFHSRYRNSSAGELTTSSTPSPPLPKTDGRAPAEADRGGTCPYHFSERSDASAHTECARSGQVEPLNLHKDSVELSGLLGVKNLRRQGASPRKSLSDLGNLGTEIVSSSGDTGSGLIRAETSDWRADSFRIEEEPSSDSSCERDGNNETDVESSAGLYHAGVTRETEILSRVRTGLDWGEKRGEGSSSGLSTQASSFRCSQREGRQFSQFSNPPSRGTENTDRNQIRRAHKQTSVSGREKRKPFDASGTVDFPSSGSGADENGKRSLSSSSQGRATQERNNCCDQPAPRRAGRQEVLVSSQSVSDNGTRVGRHSPVEAASPHSRRKLGGDTTGTQQAVSHAMSSSVAPKLDPDAGAEPAAPAVLGHLPSRGRSGKSDRGAPVLFSSKPHPESTELVGKRECTGEVSEMDTHLAAAHESVVWKAADGPSSLAGMRLECSSFGMPESTGSAMERHNVDDFPHQGGPPSSSPRGTGRTQSSRYERSRASSLRRSFSSLSSSISFLLGGWRSEQRTRALSRSRTSNPIPGHGGGAAANNTGASPADAQSPRSRTSPKEETGLSRRLRHRSRGLVPAPGPAGQRVGASSSSCNTRRGRDSGPHSLTHGRTSSFASSSVSASLPDCLLPDDRDKTLTQDTSPDFSSFSPRLAMFLTTCVENVLTRHPSGRPRVLVLNEKDSVGVFLRALQEKRLSSCVVRHTRRRFGVKSVYSFADARDFCYLVMRTLHLGPSLSFREMLAAVQVERLGTLANISKRSPFFRHSAKNSVSTLCGSFKICSRVPIFNGRRLSRIIRGREILAMFQREGVLQELEKSLLETLRAAARISVCSIRESESLLKAMVLMERHGYSAIPIVSERCHLTVLEMLTVADIQYLILAQQELRSDHIMNDPALSFVRCVRKRLQPVTPYVFVRDTAGLSEIIAAFVGESSDHPTGVKRVFLTDERGKAKGMLTISKVLEILANAVGTFSRVPAVTRLPSQHPAHNGN
ncbi:hypothetical protein CSUI_003658 [Cystoisospora suis]|uniref:CBS domain-containing protein n=1 Tax=Cystoisospora suis TaxID=483139 RepID=A0A2C6L1M0_9APIC|nr:hypothetical protein CSUI_003658 [Cystoisospora suis]